MSPPRHRAGPTHALLAAPAFALILGCGTAPDWSSHVLVRGRLTTASGAPAARARVIASVDHPGGGPSGARAMATSDAAGS
jgi:hypothetical protein